MHLKQRYLPVFAAAWLCAFGLSPDASAEVPAPTITSETEVDAQSGHITLRWALPDGAPPARFELKHAREPAFADPRSVAQTAGTQSFVSGLAGGAHYFRVRAVTSSGEQSAWSPGKELVVQHHPLGVSLAFFAVGAIVFGLTVAFIATGGFGAATARSNA